MSLVHNLVARFRADTGSFDRNIKKSRTHMTRFGKDMQRVSRQLLAFGGGYVLLNRTTKWAIRSFMEQEKAERSLMAATGESIAQFKKYAAGIQQLTIYGDEQLLSQMAYAKNLGVTTDQLEAATTAAVGLAAKYRLDLATSMMLVGRASQGQTQMLTRYGIALKESLSKQDKFNALLKIGAASFHLAEAETETLEGAWRQFANATGDIAETVVGHWLDVGKGLHDVAQHYAGVKKSAESTEEVMKRIRDSGYQANMFGAFYYPAPTKKKPPKLSAEQQDFGAFADKWGKRNSAFAADIKRQTEERKTAYEIAQKYIDSIRTEIQLTGLVGEARQHAAQMIKLETDLRKAGIDKTIAGTEKIKEMGVELEKLSKAQKLAKIGEDIGDSFAGAFEDMIFEAKRFGDVMKSLMRDVSRSVMRNIITEPLAQGITKAFVMHGGGTVGQGGGMERNVSAMAFVGAPRLHNGLMADEFPTILQRGEQVIPKGGGGGATVINIYNESGVPLEQSGEPFFNGEEVVINIVAKNIQQGGQLARMLEGK